MLAQFSFLKIVKQSQFLDLVEEGDKGFNIGKVLLEKNATLIIYTFGWAYGCLKK